MVLLKYTPNEQRKASQKGLDAAKENYELSGHELYYSSPMN